MTLSNPFATAHGLGNGRKPVLVSGPDLVFGPDTRQVLKDLNDAIAAANDAMPAGLKVTYQLTNCNNEALTPASDNHRF